jgi:hypothetical protein
MSTEPGRGTGPVVETMIPELLQNLDESNTATSRRKLGSTAKR